MGADKNQRNKRGPNFRIDKPRIWIPLDVLQSTAYSKLSISAKALLLDIAAQLRARYGDIYNNGDLTTAMKVLGPRGWRSDKTIRGASKELENAFLIVKTRQGCLPNKANLYAVTWYPLNKMDKLDVSTVNFPLNRYLLFDSPPPMGQPKKVNA